VRARIEVFRNGWHELPFEKNGDTTMAKAMLKFIVDTALITGVSLWGQSRRQRNR
jgi:hypothetical protein